jgi:hypothetical protein
MPAPNPHCIHLSASAIGCFKACPQLYRLRYREGVRPADDTDSQRQGTNWHAMHETWAGAISKVANIHEPTAMDAVINLLNDRYAHMPAHKTVKEWALERTILMVSFIGYQWYYSEDPVEILASEVGFELPVHEPRTGLPLPLADVVRIGKMDHIIRWQGMVGVLERKSTSRSVAADSDYWDKAKKDTQVSMYALAFRDMVKADKLDELIGGWSSDWEKAIEAGTFRLGNTLYDVWHKPTIKPAMLTQKETAEFIQTGKYHDQEFEVECGHTDGFLWIKADGEEVEIESGKKSYAIRETVGMFGARLLADIYERPDFYYARREIARTDQEIRRFRGELYNIYQAMRMYDRTQFWWENEHQCRANRACDMIPICYGPGADAVCDGTTTPQGFKRIFVDVTVHGEALPEE